MTTINQVKQQPDADVIVHLFELDATNLGDSTVRRFTSSAFATDMIYFDGNPYSPIDFEAKGFEWNGKGALPTPTFKIANTSNVLSSLVFQFNDLLGATLTRIRTFKRFLDGEPDADPTAYFPKDIYRIERKVTQNKLYIEFELAAAMDQQGRMLPGRQILRDTCGLRYRFWDGSAFDYTKATCPYVAANYYTPSGGVTTPEHDVCGKKLTDCKLRFGTDPLPFGAFPGVAKVRIR